jgi:nitroreductase
VKPVDLFALVESRGSVRRYSDRPVPDDILLSIVEAARSAPSADNTQPWRFIVVKDPRALQRLTQACFSGIYRPTRFAARAPVIVALCAERAVFLERAGEIVQRIAFHQLDCGIAGEHLVLAATAHGLGTCWIGWFDRRAAKKTLGLPGHAEVVSLISVGYAAADAVPRRRSRKPLSAILWLDAWGMRYPGADQRDDREK